MLGIDQRKDRQSSRFGPDRDVISIVVRRSQRP
jgi:hypothetical protein